ncbi:MAG: hypothetical protein WCI72_05165 [archaeon]
MVLEITTSQRGIVVPKSTISSLEAIAKAVFPMEIDGYLPLREIGENDVAVGIVLRYDDIDIRAFIYSNNFESLTKCLEHNNLSDIELQAIREKHKEAGELFKLYKECQRRRKENECHTDSVQGSVCEKCSAYGQPRIPQLYKWFPKLPNIAWHCHVTSEYGDATKLSTPSIPDSRAVATRISTDGIPIKAEMITCTSESDEQITKIYSLPSEGIFGNQRLARVELPF